MNFYKDEHFRLSSKYKFPSPSAGVKKDDSYFLKFFQAMYSEFIRDRGGILYSRRNEFALNRLYAEGNQPVEKYMNQLCPWPEGSNDFSDNSTRTGWMNVSWDILSVAPKFERIFVGMFEKIEHEIVATSINDKAVQEKEDFKWQLWAEKQMSDFFNGIDKMMLGKSSQPEWLPDTLQELEIFMSESFKTKLEMAIEMGLEYSFYISQWNETKKKMFEDWFRLGIAACQDVVEDGKVKALYRDISRLIVPYSRDKNFSDIGYWGYVDEWSVAQVRQRTGMKEDELKKIAESYTGYLDNIIDDSWSFTNLNKPNDSELPYDTWKVMIMYGEFICSEEKKIKTIKSNNGASEIYVDKSIPEDKWTKVSREERSVDNQIYQTVKKGYWIVGTDKVFECGDVYCMPRENKRNPKLSLHIHRYSNKSILSSIIPLLDSIQLAWVKLQNSKAMAAPDGVDIEIGSLENISIDGKKCSPLEILTLRRQSGDTVYKATTHGSQYNNGGQVPIKDVQRSIENQLKGWILSIDNDLNMIRQITGMNEVIDSSSPKERTPVTTSEMAITAANNALQPVYSGYVNVKENCAKNMVSRYQCLAANGNIKGHYPSLGKNVMQIFELSSDCSSEEYAIKLKAKPTDEMKNAIRATVIEAEKLGTKNGGISHSDALYIEEKIGAGELKYARMFIAYKEKYYEQQIQAAAAQNQAMSGQAAQAAEAAKTEGAIAVKKIESQLDIDSKNIESELRRKENEELHRWRMEEIAAEGMNRVKDTETKNEGVLANTYAQADVNNENVDSEAESK